jgi:hypothetical protein
VYYAYQGMENEDNADEHEINTAALKARFKEFIAHAQPGEAHYTYHYRYAS